MKIAARKLSIIAGLVFSLLLFTLLIAHPVNAEDPINSSSWTTPLFSTRLEVSRDNNADITETINFDFGASPGHGIERFIPLWVRYNQSWRYLRYNFKLERVTVDGREASVVSTKRNSNQYLRIGEADKTITGVHTYKIQYHMSPIVQDDPAGDYLNWNLIGTSWNTPIQKAIGTVYLPKEANIKDSRCYTGEQGSTAQNCTIITQPDHALLVEAKESLNTHEGLSINVLTNHGVFSNYLKPGAPPPVVWVNILGVVIGIGAFIAGLAIRFFSWLFERRRKANQTVIAEYEPPDGLSPAEIGQLNDSKTSNIETTATIIDLAVRGYIKLEQTAKKALLRKAAYRVHFLKSVDANLKPHEKLLYDLLYTGVDKDTDPKSAVAEISKLRPSSINSTMPKFFKAIEQSNKDKGYYKKITKSGTKKWNNIIGVIILLLIVLSLAPVIAIVSGWLGFIVGIVGIVFGLMIARRNSLAAAGVAEWAKVEGFKLFLSVTEKDRLAFTDAPAKTPQQFSKFLPYAIALGVEKEWATQFKDIDIRNACNWYTGAYVGYAMPIDFVNDLSTNLPSGFNVVTSSSSGGYGGGGSSGGGGGGGGGGGW